MLDTYGLESIGGVVKAEGTAKGPESEYRLVKSVIGPFDALGAIAGDARSACMRGIAGRVSFGLGYVVVIEGAAGNACRARDTVSSPSCRGTRVV